MPHLPTLESDSAPKEVLEVYHDFQRRMGFPAAPNFIKTQGHSLAANANTIADATGMSPDKMFTEF